MVVNGRELPGEDRAAAAIMEKCPEVVGVVKNINRERTNRVLGHSTRAISGRDYLLDSVDDLLFRISLESFFQVNLLQTETLYDRALETAQLAPHHRVLDVFCGIGTISLYFARFCRDVLGIEVVEAAVEDARENALRNNLSNVQFRAGAAEKELPRLAAEDRSFDVVVVDPPRKGIDEAALQALAQLTDSRIVYVSCNPSTLARDLKRLDTMGWSAGTVQPVDMFPHTTHVECVVGLEHM
jgi:23S rRNA (uracil1939-C5)-methyltransferase